MQNSSTKLNGQKRLKNRSLLVVDDDANSRLLLKTFLTAEGYSVHLVKNGEDAIHFCLKNAPDLVILDVRLPGIDGYEVCSRIKSMEGRHFIPIVMATALRGDEQRIKGVEAGADDFISKPYNRVELITRVRSLLRISGLHHSLSEKVKELEIIKEKLKLLAVTDGLTGLYNHRAFKHQFKLEISRAKRFSMPLSLLMLDIDHFKRYNDRWGHPQGDKLLAQFGHILQSNIRDVDCPARYGGEEFAIILWGTDNNSAKIVAEKLRKLVESTPFEGREVMSSETVTISLGIASYPTHATNAAQLIDLADRALYHAKKMGRNQWQTA